MSRIHLRTLPESEKQFPVETASSSGDKAYLKIRCEAKLVDGALEMICNRGGVLR
ncbi:MAG: hypothetical protein Q7R60_00640 [bacterium]|nr:hypothetical protein [bacterium]